MCTYQVKVIYFRKLYLNYLDERIVLGASCFLTGTALEEKWSSLGEMRTHSTGLGDRSPGLKSRLWKKSKMTQTNGELYHVLGLKDSILWKWLYCTKQSMYLMNLGQITKGIFHRIKTKYFAFWMETQKTPNIKSNPEKEKWSWRNQSPQPQTILQSYSNQNSMYWHKNRNIDQ